MSETSNKSMQQTSEDLLSATSSQASLFGPSPSASPDGPMTARAGLEAAPVRPSRVQAKGKGLTTLVTSGRTGIPSSASVALEQSLVNRLMTRLDSAGSTLFRQTWKRRVTPLRRRYWEHTASAQATSVNGCTSVPTPKQPKFSHDMAKFKREPGRKSPTDLETAVYLSTVPTPMAGSPATETYNAAGNNDYSRKIVELATVSTPRAQERQQQNSADSNAALSHQVKLANVATPSGRDWKDTSGMSEIGVDPDGSIRSRLDQLPRQAQLADSGATATGGTPATESIGQLNPDYSRWLMGLPTVFSNCADTAMQSVRNLRKRSSKKQ
jgi:hypothetical protein